MLELEKQRTAGLLRAVVELDKERAPFSVVGVEQTRAVTIENVSLRVRIDRIDRLGTDEVVILDYKTGAPKKFLGTDDLPRDVQLIVYSFAVGERVSDVGLVNIDSRLVEVDGAGKTLSPDLDWDNVLSLWRRAVEEAASGFSRGDVRLYGAHSVQTARPLALLSRIGEFRRDR